jgi:hypothetical protein
MRTIVLFSLLCSFTQVVHAGNLVLGGVIGSEEVNRKVSGNVYSIRSMYRLDSGAMFGSVAQFGVIDSAYAAFVSDEQRFEVIAGYTTRLNNTRISPYVFLSQGLRKFSEQRPSANYHTVVIGGNYLITKSVYLDGYYKYRNSNDIDWEANLYSVGIGFSFSPKHSVQVNVGRTKGDYYSQFYNIAFNRRF